MHVIFQTTILEDLSLLSNSESAEFQGLNGTPFDPAEHVRDG